MEKNRKVWEEWKEFNFTDYSKNKIQPYMIMDA